MNDHGPDEEKAAFTQLAILKQEHGDLDASLSAVLAQPMPDQLLAMRLKKKKLALRDQIVCLEGRLTPDIIA
ncbi:MAG: DUF465 domain-containing protein [Proteobacteria bacterium]|nr:DUF465 domain-containing protein [Pseudomonadota bacterium]MBW3618005.1 DUF465 domain-containing protein [Pseudomonadota bacterium]